MPDISSQRDSSTSSRLSDGPSNEAIGAKLNNHMKSLSTPTGESGALTEIFNIFQSQHPAYDGNVKIGLKNYCVTGDGLYLSSINALVNPGEMCLVLADSSATTSAFLKALKGECEATNEFNNIILKKDNLIYNDEVDVHFPHLTVDQTIQFALDCTFNIHDSTKNDIKHTLIDMFGLDHCLNTVVGNDYVRGISGGERKRVSIIESLIANGLVYLWDNSTKGLDSSTALEFIESLKQMTKLHPVTHIIGLNQVSEKMIGLFDKVLLFYKSTQIFFGTIESLLKFLRHNGFHKSACQTDIEFLNDILGSELNVKELELKWKLSQDFEDLQGSLEYYATKSSIETHKQKSNFKIPILKQLHYCVKRHHLRTKGDRTYIIAQTISTVIQALVIGSLFYDMPVTTIGSFSRGSIIFFSLLFFCFLGLAEIPSCFSQRPIIKKQRDLFFYHPAVETLATLNNDLIFKLFLNVVFSIILYFLSGMQRNAARFFVFLLFLLLSTESMSLLFQAIAYISPTIATADSLGGLLILSIAMYASYVIYLKQMHPWFGWISYINPIRYGFETMLANELFNLNLECSGSLIPSGGAYDSLSDDYKVCGWQGATLGKAYVEGRYYLKDAFTYSYAHTWRNFGILIAFCILFFGICLVSSEYITIRYDSKKLTNVNVAAKESENEVETDSESLEKADALKFEKDLILSWEKISYRVNGHLLLNDVYGYVSSGGLTALMGESGAGKTTLLNTLSKRIDYGVVEGDILINHLQTEGDAFKANTGYVQQQDLHVIELTIQESLEFSCKLRGDSDLKYVDSVLKKLNLQPERLVKTLSPKDQKMLSIGVELVTKPIILFLDEPTSGLENDAALSIVKLLKDLSAAGQAILCTIHQPSTSMFKHFDKLLLLQTSGQTVYFGNADETCTDYFSRNGAQPIQENENPAEYILNVIGAGAGVKSEKDWVAIWVQSPECHELKDTITFKEFDEKYPEDLYSKVAKPKYLHQFYLVLVRTWKQFIRDRTYLTSKLLLMIIAGLYIGFTFWKTKGTIMGLQNIVFAIFMILVISSPLVQQIQAKSLASKNVFLAREFKSKTFHWTILVLTQVIAEIPFLFVGATLLYVSFYFTIGITTASYAAGVFYLNYLLFSLYFLTFGLWLVYSSPNLETAHVFVGFIFSFTVSFCGVMQPKQLMPKFWLFMYRVSPYTYFIDNFVSLVLHNREIKCASDEYALFKAYGNQTCGEYMESYIDRKGGYLLYPDSKFICSYCSYKTGDQFLKTENLSYDNIWRNFGIIWVFIVFNFAAMCIGFYFSNIKRLNLRKTIKRLRSRIQATRAKRT